ncbi:MAG: histidine--tRNA ligase [Candidatus Thermoplasmatota archaeon]|jgi:histidyl-tRNA synthetase|nr:histidine--tRNA ligase [Candidatus Thermoplasmatota archaeon]
MMMVEFQPPRGTRDFGPEEMERRRRAEELMRAVIENYGYREISTPTFESAELFISRSGPQVIEQMYLFKDKGDRDMVLRPELTAPVMRFYSSTLKNVAKPLRIYYFGNCFRYERPQKGRYREFWQMGLEYIGKRTPLAHAEVISAAIGSLMRVGVPELCFRIGHVTVLRAILRGVGLDPDSDRDLMIAIDKKDMAAISSKLDHLGEDVSSKVTALVTTTYTIDQTPTALAEISKMARTDLSEPIKELTKLFSILDRPQGMVLFDPSISRGLDYYDGVVFEADVPSLGAEKQVCGGGAYSLSSVFGTEVEGIGFGLGFDRILLSLGDLGSNRPERTGFYIVPMGETAWGTAFEAAALIRSKGILCMMETMERPLKRAISSAVDNGCTHLLIVGENEVREGRFALKELRTQVQTRVSFDELAIILEGLS